MANSFFEYPEKAFKEEEIDGFKKIDVISTDALLFTSACQVFKCILEKLTYNLDKELRIIVNYDPQRKKVRIRYFTQKETQD